MFFQDWVRRQFLPQQDRLQRFLSSLSTARRIDFLNFFFLGPRKLFPLVYAHEAPPLSFSPVVMDNINGPGPPTGRPRAHLESSRHDVQRTRGVVQS
jgi:hypothetical protein